MTLPKNYFLNNPGSASSKYELLQGWYGQIPYVINTAFSSCSNLKNECRRRKELKKTDQKMVWFPMFGYAVFEIQGFENQEKFLFPPRA